MLSLDQVNLLESKVEKAVELIRSLSAEKDNFKAVLAEKENRIAELERLIITFKDEQSKIEKGIANALNKLSAFENSSYKDSSIENSSSPQKAVTDENQVQGKMSGGDIPHPYKENQYSSVVSKEAETNEDLNEILGNALNPSSTVRNSESEMLDDSDKQMDIF